MGKFVLVFWESTVPIRKLKVPLLIASTDMQLMHFLTHDMWLTLNYELSTVLLQKNMTSNPVQREKRGVKPKLES